jgi:hypothetical protein
MKKSIVIFFAILIAAFSHAELTNYFSAVETPSDGGSGPTLWYKTARSPSYGTATNTLVSGYVMTNLTADFWGNANSAFGLTNGATGAAAVVGSTGKFTTGTVGTVSFMFKTPGVAFVTNTIFGQGQGAFEVMMVNGNLRITTLNGSTPTYTTLSSSALSVDTWYFLAMSWDLSKSSNDLTWAYGKAGDTLNSGAVTMTSAGATNSAIYIGGRSTASVFGGFFQNIAIYDRALSPAAIENQFSQTLAESVQRANAYESTISSPTDGGGGPALWYKNANTKSGEHMLNSGLAGSAYQAYRLGGALYSDLWGNTNMAFGSTNAIAPTVANSSGLFATGAVGTVCFLFQTPSTMPTNVVILFSQGSIFTVALNGPSSAIRIAHTNSGAIRYSNTVSSVKTGTWYYFAMKWDTAKASNDLTWYAGEAGSSLQSGTLTINSAGAATSIQIDALNAPMKEVAVWEREISEASITSQFNATIQGQVNPQSYTLTVNSGSGSGQYTNEAQVAISASNLFAKTFAQWIGDTQYLASAASSASNTVIMPTSAVTLTATYVDTTYALTVNSGTGGGSYTNEHIQAIAANTPASGYAFDKWTGDTQYIASASASTTTVTMPLQAVTVTATYIATEQYTTNGTPYSWLDLHGLTNHVADDVLDQDGDGLKAWQEYIAGTDPTNSASCLAAAQTTRNVITWTAQSNRIYSVYWSTNLVQGFTALNTNIVYPQNSYTNTTPDSRVNYYQVRVWIP